jgi:hypothetical protein
MFQGKKKRHTRSNGIAKKNEKRHIIAYKNTKYNVFTTL